VAVLYYTGRKGENKGWVRGVIVVLGTEWKGVGHTQKYPGKFTLQGSIAAKTPASAKQSKLWGKITPLLLLERVIQVKLLPSRNRVKLRSTLTPLILI
jgi:hypothetical protein